MTPIATTSEHQPSLISGMGGQLQRAVGYFCGRLRCMWVRSGCAITMMAKQALDRAVSDGAHHGAYLFSHSLAPDLLRPGASFAEIGPLLRHSSIDCTRIRPSSISRSCANRAWPEGPQ